MTENHSKETKIVNCDGGRQPPYGECAPPSKSLPYVSLLLTLNVLCNVLAMTAECPRSTL